MEPTCVVGAYHYPAPGMSSPIIWWIVWGSEGRSSLSLGLDIAAIEEGLKEISSRFTKFAFPATDKFIER